MEGGLPQGRVVWERALDCRKSFQRLPAGTKRAGHPVSQSSSGEGSARPRHHGLERAPPSVL